jgi:hypothetical protein
LLTGQKSHVGPEKDLLADNFPPFIGKDATIFGSVINFETENSYIKYKP